MNTNVNSTINRSVNSKINTVRFAAVRTITTLALCALAALAANTAKADVYVDKLFTPSQQCGLPASDTALQFHVINSGTSAVSNNKINITLQTWADGPTSRAFTFSSASFNLTAYQQEWITVMIPAKEYGLTLKGQELKGSAVLGRHSYYLDFNDNGSVNNWPPVAPAHLEISSVTPPAGSQRNNAPFTITVTNNGGKASVAATLKVIMQPWADGPDGTSTTRTATIPVLQPLESKTFTFDAIDYDSDELEGNIYINTTFEQGFSFWG